VQFRLDGSLLGTEDTTAPYSVTLDTTTVANGTHTVTATARDAAGNTATTPIRTFTVANAPPAANGPVASYSFDAGSGTTLADRSGRGHDGVISGATWSASGHTGGALSFDGVNDWVTVADHADLDLTNGLTLEAWVNPSTASGWRTILMKELTTRMSYGMYGSGTPNRPSGYFDIGGAEVNVTGTAAPTANTWVHVAVTYDGSTLRLYVNGTQVATRAQAGSITASSGPLRIGGNAIWGEYYAGRIDDVRIYNRALTAAEIVVDRNTPVA
jgi:hypothetical protein